jgi:aminopeptidase N
MDLYFERHDGQAVTCEEFRMAIADANGEAVSQAPATCILKLENLSNM